MVRVVGKKVEKSAAAEPRVIAHWSWGPVCGTRVKHARRRAYGCGSSAIAVRARRYCERSKRTKYHFHDRLTTEAARAQRDEPALSTVGMTEQNRGPGSKPVPRFASFALQWAQGTMPPGYPVDKIFSSPRGDENSGRPNNGKAVRGLSRLVVRVSLSN